MSPPERDAPGRHSVRYGSERIDFSLIRRDRKTLAITVHPDLAVEVLAPSDATDGEVLAKVRKRARWILRQQRQFLSWMPKPMPRKFRSGETHRFLGGQYRLKVLKGGQTSVKLSGSFLEVRTPNPTDPATIKKAVTSWYREHARSRFRKQLAEAISRMRAYDLPEPRLRLLRMPKRWGSCTPAAEVILNPDLIKTASPCIEYVIVHELCHLRHPNHSQAFFLMLDAVLPDWRQRKARLERSEI